MKLMRWGARGEEKPGLIDKDGSPRDLSGIVGDITPDLLSPEGLQRLAQIDAGGLPKVPHAARLGIAAGVALAAALVPADLLGTLPR